MITAVVQGGLVGRIAARLGEPRALLLGLAAGAVSQVLYGLATQGWQLYAVMLAGALAGLVMPVTQSLVTRQVEPGEQGAVQGALASLTSLAAVVMPPVATVLFGRFGAPDAAPYIPGIAFFLGAALMGLATVSAARALGPRDPRRPRPAPPVLAPTGAPQ